MISIILDAYLIEIFFRRFFKDSRPNDWKKKLLGPEDIMIQNKLHHYLRVKHSREDLEEVFKVVDVNGDREISFDEYMSFVRKYPCKGVYIQEEKPVKTAKVPGVSE